MAPKDHGMHAEVRRPTLVTDLHFAETALSQTFTSARYAKISPPNLFSKSWLALTVPGAHACMQVHCGWLTDCVCAECERVE